MLLCFAPAEGWNRSALQVPLQSLSVLGMLWQSNAHMGLGAPCASQAKPPIPEREACGLLTHEESPSRAEHCDGVGSSKSVPKAQKDEEALSWCVHPRQLLSSPFQDSSFQLFIKDKTSH